MTRVRIGDSGFYDEIIASFCVGCAIQNRIRDGCERKTRYIGIDIEGITTARGPHIIHIVVGICRPGIVVEIRQSHLLGQGGTV